MALKSFTFINKTLYNVTCLIILLCYLSTALRITLFFSKEESFLLIPSFSPLRTDESEQIIRYLIPNSTIYKTSSNYGNGLNRSSRGAENTDLPLATRKSGMPPSVSQF